MRMPDQDVRTKLEEALGLPAESTELLDNPIWNALRTEHVGIALGGPLARRYPSDIGPLSGIPAQGDENFAALAALAPQDIVVLFLLEPIRPLADWTVLRKMEVVQMVRVEPPAEVSGTRSWNPPTMRLLTAADAAAMVALAELTEPGPFRLRTMELGGFYGIFEGERLVSMAGRRMHLPGFIEVSAVCTHPDARGRGYAGLLMERVIEEIETEGKTPFLHAYQTNPAIRLYERLGFRLRQTFRCTVLKCMGEPEP